MFCMELLYFAALFLVAEYEIGYVPIVLCQKFDPLLVAIFFFGTLMPNFEYFQYNPCSLLDDFMTFVTDMCHIARDRPVWVTEVSFSDGGGHNPRQGKLTDSHPHSSSPRAARTRRRNS